MPFVSRKNYNELVSEAAKSPALREAMKATNIMNEALMKVISARDDELDSVGAFLRFLAKHVPDYEGYVLDYMDQEEFSSEDSA